MAKLDITILTLFPEMFKGPFDYSMVKRASDKKNISIKIVNIRDYGLGAHKMVDDTPYGGGTGMILRVDVLHKAIKSVQRKNIKEKVILMSAQGTTFTQKNAISFSKLDHLIIVCGHYEGFDERVKTYIDQEISLGDFITTGGEIPAMLITDAVVRLVDTVLKEGVTNHESFSLTENNKTLLEYPHFTRPDVYEHMEVPEILRSGNHKRIDAWRMEKARQQTRLRRPDLLRGDTTTGQETK
jgi:tRNA (guanine37-N1)-methyltransferase